MVKTNIDVFYVGTEPVNWNICPFDHIWEPIMNLFCYFCTKYSTIITDILPHVKKLSFVQSCCVVEALLWWLSHIDSHTFAMKPCFHGKILYIIKNIVQCASVQSSQEMCLPIRAYVVNVRPLLEYALQHVCGHHHMIR